MLRQNVLKRLTISVVGDGSVGKDALFKAYSVLIPAISIPLQAQHPILRCMTLGTQVLLN
jgi:hypothetical protein